MEVEELKSTKIFIKENYDKTVKTLRTHDVNTVTRETAENVRAEVQKENDEKSL